MAKVERVEVEKVGEVLKERMWEGRTCHCTCKVDMYGEKYKIVDVSYGKVTLEGEGDREAIKKELIECVLKEVEEYIKHWDRGNDMGTHGYRADLKLLIKEQGDSKPEA